MFAKSMLLAAVAVAQHAAAAAVSGTPEGFAAGVTGGGSASAVTPTTNDELVSYLSDSTARVIVLTKTFDFTDADGTATETGCAPWGTGSGCQLAINKDKWCDNYQKDAPTASVTYSKAGLNPLKVGSNKSIIGEGSKGVIVGKGLRLSNSKNVIIQNIKVENINPKYVWGGDAISLDGTDLVWIDHVTTSKIGRQHLVLGNSASGRVSVTNNEFDGKSDYSATCDGQHYWSAYFAGSSDTVTLKGNYFHDFSGRAPKINGNTFVHAVNNYWSTSTGHAFEVTKGGYVLAEGNVFSNVKAAIEAGGDGASLAITSSNASECKSKLGRNCQANSFSSSGEYTGTDSSVLSKFGDSDIPDAVAASSVSSSAAGYGKI
ncbi:pectin lyase [Colletotrichum truncatum]|uniref:Pectin lyase n=1 Tax=Colletotrichum truncatum TaxID=5467 RepID=A0ACC3YQ93_COLTU|nr:pectin lyase [Colletotrichum truncatum]KAF6796706.1 pectin lyase [Colletotrichum truncatum]